LLLAQLELRITSIRLKIIGRLLEMQLGSLAVCELLFIFSPRASPRFELKCLFARTESAGKEKIIKPRIQNSIKALTAFQFFFFYIYVCTKVENLKLI